LESVSGVLLPLGPNDGFLPGSQAVWDEMLSSGEPSEKESDRSAFEGIQAVKNIADFSRAAVAELFLSGTPRNVFQLESTLLVLNSNGAVQLVDCGRPRKPKIVAVLPVPPVEQVVMRGSEAYLLLKNTGTRDTEIMVVDLENPQRPDEIARFTLSGQIRYFFFSEDHLVAYENTKGQKRAHFVYLYELSETFQPALLGKIKSPPIGYATAKVGPYLISPGLREGINIYDFSSPLQPIQVSSLAFPGKIKRLVQYGDKLFAHGEQGIIYVINLHDNEHPKLSSTIDDARYYAYFMTFGDYKYYFTGNGYLRVFETPVYEVPGHHGRKTYSKTAGEFVPLAEDSKSTLPEDADVSMIAADALPWMGETGIIDTLYWQDLLVVLDDQGEIYFYGKDNAEWSQRQERLRLPASQRWLAAGDKRLFAGGQATIDIIKRDGNNRFSLNSQFELDGKSSWDGLVLRETLCIAAGRNGLLCFSLEDSDRLVEIPGWTVPKHLQTQVDARQLAESGDDRVFVAAGQAGLVEGRLSGSGQVQFSGVFSFAGAVNALGVIDGLCMVSNGTEVYAIDIRSRGSMQNLGKIAFSAVERITAVSNDYWAGYVANKGWFLLPVPRFVSRDDLDALKGMRAEMNRERHQHYRLNLFNDHEVVNVPGIFSLPPLSGLGSSGVENAVN
jgi:hypothetical protein